MKIQKLGVLMLGALLFCSPFALRTKADGWDHKTIVTFSDYVEIPGQVLAPGTYVMKLADSPSYRHIVQFWTADGRELLATVFAIPNQRFETSDGSIFEFDERPANSPQALRAWFYPGETTGEEFVYHYNYGNNRSTSYQYNGSK